MSLKSYALDSLVQPLSRFKNNPEGTRANSNPDNRFTSIQNCCSRRSSLLRRVIFPSGCRANGQARRENCRYSQRHPSRWGDKTAKEVERVSRVVGREDKIVHRAAVLAASGSWLRLVDSTNSLICRLPLRSWDTQMKVLSPNPTV